MATRHGFRIYNVRAYPTQRAKNPPLAAGRGSGMADRITALLDQAFLDGTQFRQPPPVLPGEPPRSATSLTVGEPHRIKDGLIHVVVALGQTGSHARAVKPGAAAQDLRDWAPEASHFVTFVFARNKDETRFLIVTETVSRHDPVDRLLAYLAKVDLRNKKTRQEAHKDAVKSARDSGTNRPPAFDYKRLVFETSQAVDNAFLDDILGSTKNATATFTSYGTDPRGGKAKPVNRKLTIKLRGDWGKQVATTVSRSWAQKVRSDDTPSLAAGVSELAGVLEGENLLEDGEGERYDHASISVTDQANQTTTVAIDTMRDVFTYPVSEGAPSPEFYYEKVAPRVRTVAREERFAADAIVPTEVRDWLDASMSGRS